MSGAPFLGFDLAHPAPKGYGVEPCLLTHVDIEIFVACVPTSNFARSRSSTGTWPTWKHGDRKQMDGRCGSIQRTAEHCRTNFLQKFLCRSGQKIAAGLHWPCQRFSLFTLAVDKRQSIYLSIDLSLYLSIYPSRSISLSTSLSLFLSHLLIYFFPSFFFLHYFFLSLFITLFHFYSFSISCASLSLSIPISLLCKSLPNGNLLPTRCCHVLAVVVVVASSDFPNIRQRVMWLAQAPNLQPVCGLHDHILGLH